MKSVAFKNVNAMLHSTNVALRQINNLLVNHQNICVLLEIKTINDAKYVDLDMSSVDDTAMLRDYMVTFMVEPGDSLFEATVRHSALIGYKVQGNIASVNPHRNPSVCVDDTFLKNYCCCKYQQQE